MIAELLYTCEEWSIDFLNAAIILGLLLSFVFAFKLIYEAPEETKIIKFKLLLIYYFWVSFWYFLLYMLFKYYLLNFYCGI